MRLEYATALIDGRHKFGMQRELEGEIAGKNVVLIDNLMRSGASIEAAVRVVERGGARVLGALTLVCHQPVELAVPTSSLWQAAELEAAAKELGLMPVGSSSFQKEKNL